MGIHVLKSARYMGKSRAWWCSSKSTDKLCDNFERSKGVLLDVNILRMCDHYLVEGRIRVTGDLSEGKEGISRRG